MLARIERVKVCALLDALGIAAEGGVWSVADANRLLSAATVKWLRILVEVIDAPAADAVGVAGRDDDLGVRHGIVQGWPDP